MNDEFIVPKEKILRFKKALEDIERWRGEAYENDDEVGMAMQEMKMLLSTIVYGDTTEVCPHCDHEQEINEVDAPCPECGKTLIACSMCTMEYGDGCGECPDGTSKMFDIKMDDFI